SRRTLFNMIDAPLLGNRTLPVGTVLDGPSMKYSVSSLPRYLELLFNCSTLKYGVPASPKRKRDGLSPLVIVTRGPRVLTSQSIGIRPISVGLYPGGTSCVSVCARYRGEASLTCM